MANCEPRTTCIMTHTSGFLSLVIETGVNSLKLKGYHANTCHYAFPNCWNTPARSEWTYAEGYLLKIRYQRR